jgi:hypothetical protein
MPIGTCRLCGALKRLAIHSPEKHILMTSDVDNLNMSDAAKLISKTRKVGALAKPDGVKTRLRAFREMPCNLCDYER